MYPRNSKGRNKCGFDSSIKIIDERKKTDRKGAENLMIGQVPYILRK